MRSHILPRALSALIAAIAVFAVACGGADVATPAPGSEATTAPPVAGTVTGQAEAQPARAVDPAEAGVATRDDSLTGAPVPAPSVQSAAFDAERLNVRAGTFPPLDVPQVVPAAEATWMSPNTLVLGAIQNGETRAYPIFMMTFHHVANDILGGEPYLVTF